MGFIESIKRVIGNIRKKFSKKKLPSTSKITDFISNTSIDEDIDLNGSYSDDDSASHNTFELLNEILEEDAESSLDIDSSTIENQQNLLPCSESDDGFSIDDEMDLHNTTLENLEKIIWSTPSHHSADSGFEDDASVLNDFVLPLTHKGIPEFLNNLHHTATECLRRGDLNTIETRCWEILEYFEYGAGHNIANDRKHIVTLLKILSFIKCGQQQYEDAVELLVEILYNRLERIEIDPKPVDRSYNGLATILWEMGEFEKAEKMLCRSLTLREKIYGQNNFNVRQQLVKLSLLSTRRGFPAKSQFYMKRARKINQQLPDMTFEF